VPASDLDIGHSEGVIQGKNIRVGVNICFESFFSEPALAQRRAGAQFLAVPTNDSYYGYSPAATTHAAYLRLRSVETGLPGVQAAITGFSLATRPDGSVIGSTSLFQRATLIAKLPQPCPVTLWVKAPWLIWSAMALLILAGYPASLARKQTARTPD
jgi:apolipoprotein N-acyltransferase